MSDGKRLPRGRLAARRWGSGGRRVLLLHGSTASSLTWWRVAPLLAAHDCTVTALDLPSHGNSPRQHGPLLPAGAAVAVATGRERERYDLVVGHSFGAAVALRLLQERRLHAEAWLLEELPGPNSVDWPAETAAVLNEAAAVRRDPAAALAGVRAAQPRWHDEDCGAAVEGLLACDAEDVAAGLQQGGGWWDPDEVPVHPDTRVLLLLAPDAAGINSLEDATALRGVDRAAAVHVLRAQVSVLDTGHCIHRDNPSAWVREARRLLELPQIAPADDEKRDDPRDDGPSDRKGCRWT